MSDLNPCIDTKRGCCTLNIPRAISDTADSADGSIPFEFYHEVRVDSIFLTKYHFHSMAPIEKDDEPNVDMS